MTLKMKNPLKRNDKRSNHLFFPFKQWPNVDLHHFQGFQTLHYLKKALCGEILIFLTKT